MPSHLTDQYADPDRYEDLAQRYDMWSDERSDHRTEPTRAGGRRGRRPGADRPSRASAAPADAELPGPGNGADAPDGPDVLDPDLPPGLHWSTWGEAVHGPEPHPDWVVTALAAVDRELGTLKSGKEADVHLVERSVAATHMTGTTGTTPGSRSLLAAKRYRDSEHRLFHRDAAYLEGRRVRRSRETRAMARRTSFGRELLAGQWAAAEFGFLGRLWSAGAPVPYPVQLAGTEVMMEFVGDDEGQAAPRLAQLRPDPDELADLWQQCQDAMHRLAEAGYAHGDLSAYNLLVHEGRLVLIDLPQAVDLAANPRGPAFLRRDVDNVGRWFAAHGIDDVDPTGLTERLLDAAGMVGAATWDREAGSADPR